MFQVAKGAVIERQVLQVAAPLNLPFDGRSDISDLNAVQAKLVDGLWRTRRLYPAPHLDFDCFGHVFLEYQRIYYIFRIKWSRSSSHLENANMETAIKELRCGEEMIE